MYTCIPLNIPLMLAVIKIVLTNLLNIPKIRRDLLPPSSI